MMEHDKRLGVSYLRNFSPSNQALNWFPWGEVRSDEVPLLSLYPATPRIPEMNIAGSGGGVT